LTQKINTAYQIVVQRTWFFREGIWATPVQNILTVTLAQHDVVGMGACGAHHSTKGVNPILTLRQFRQPLCQTIIGRTFTSFEDVGDTKLVKLSA